MARVSSSYNPVPQVGPSARAIPNVAVQAVEEAFGGGISQALGQVGRQFERAGDELFARAVALQQLDNDAAAKDADSEYMIQAGQRHAEFQSLQGRAAKDAYPGYVNDLKTLRESIRETLPNDQARKMFDGSSRSFFARTVFNGAGHAASQNKRYLVDSSKARVDLINGDVLANSPTEEIFGQSVAEAVAEVRQQGALLGWGQDQIDNQISHNVSQLWATRIVGTAKTNPFAAHEMFKRNKDKIRGQDQEKVENQVRTQMRTVGSRNISEVVNDGWAAYMKPADTAKAIGVEDALTRVVKRAQQIADVEFTIGGEGGRRTPEQQAKLVEKGVSKTLDSEHLRGRAIDLVPLKNGQPDYKDREGYGKIAAAMQKASEELGIPLAPKSQSFTSWDPAHFSLPKDYDVSKSPKAVEEPLQARVDRAKTYATKTIGEDDPTFPDFAGDRVIADFNKSKAIKRDFDFTNRNTVESALMGGLGDGKIPTTVEELKATDPKAAAAWDNLDPEQQRKFMKSLASNAKGDTSMTPDGLKRYQELRGMAQADPAEFLGVDVVSEKLPIAVRKELVNLQTKMRGKAEQDPQVAKAMQTLQPILIPAGIDRTRDKAGYYQFVGALQDAIKDFQGESKKAPTQEQVIQMGSRLLQEQAGTGWFTNYKLFEVPVPDDIKGEIESDVMWQKIGIKPTPEMIQRVYTRSLYQKLYGKAPKAEEGGPKPPISK